MQAYSKQILGIEQSGFPRGHHISNSFLHHFYLMYTLYLLSTSFILRFSSTTSNTWIFLSNLSDLAFSRRFRCIWKSCFHRYDIRTNLRVFFLMIFFILLLNGIFHSLKLLFWKLNFNHPFLQKNMSNSHRDSKQQFIIKLYMLPYLVQFSRNSHLLM